MNIRHRLRALFPRLRQGCEREAELERELRSHLELETEEQQDAGLPPEEARYAACRAFGNPALVKEEVREMWGWTSLERLGQDLRYGLRQLRRTPGFTAVALLTLTLGIGANTAIFSVVDAVLLAPLPYADAGRLVDVYQKTQGGSSNVFSSPNFLAWRDHAEAFQQIAAWTAKSYNLADANRPEHITGTPVTANIFSLLGVNPMLGRSFLAREDVPGGPKVVVLSQGFWRQHFGGTPGAIGSSLALNGESYTVVGVMPRNFQVPNAAGQLWVPLQLNPADANSSARGVHWLFGIARLKPGATLAQTEAQISSLAPQMAREYPQTDAGFGLQLVPLLDDVVGTVRPVLQILLAAVGLVLLIGCVNITNLLLARGAARRREMALRAALGASRARVVRQLLTESGLLALLGDVFGLALAFGAVHALASLAPEGAIPRIKDLSVNGQALAFALLATLITALAFGAFLALQASKADLNEAVKESNRSVDTSRTRGRLRGALVVSEVGVALMLLVGAGLMIVSFLNLKNVNPGFDARNILSMKVSLPASKYTSEQLAAFRQALVRGVASLPGVQSAALTRNLPLSGIDPSLFFTIPGRPPVAPGQQPIARARFVTPNYFHTMGIPLRRGRDFTEQDGPAAPGAVIVSETMARQFWPNQDAVGKQIQPGYPASSLLCTVVGVVGDVRQFLSIEEPPVAYYPYAQVPANFVPLVEDYLTLTLRTASAPGNLTSSVREQIHAVDPNAPIFEVQTMDDLLTASAASNRFQTLLFGIFAAMGLVLAAVGIYGVISYSVTQRTHEIGIRMTLGAERGQVLTLIVGEGMLLALIGVGIGLAGALGLSRLMAGLLYAVKPSDPATFAGVAGVLLAAALMACYIPARRATKVDPMVALRHE